MSSKGRRKPFGKGKDRILFGQPLLRPRHLCGKYTGKDILIFPWADFYKTSNTFTTMPYNSCCSHDSIYSFCNKLLENLLPGRYQLGNRV